MPDVERSIDRSLSDPAAASRVTMLLLGLFLLWPALEWTEFNPAALLDERSRETAWRFIASFFPLETSPEFLQLIAQATLQTLAIATAGMTLALLIGCPLALLITRTLSIGRIGPSRRAHRGTSIRLPARGTTLFLRSVPEIVWALLFVRAVGLGPAAGVLAIGVTYGGMLAKVYAEVLESSDARPVRALLEAGSGRISAFFYGLWPVALPELASYTVYRWECAIRASVIMGFVGAGGLGQQMELSMRMLNGGEVCTILLVFLLLVFLADAASALLRRMTA